MRPLLALTLLVAVPAFADACDRVAGQVAELDRDVAKLRADYAAAGQADLADPAEVRRYLAMLVAVDQAVREAAMTWPALHGYDSAENTCFWTLVVPRWENIDDASSDALEGLMALHHWITVPRFGADAADQAWLLAQHADRRRDFQRRVLATLGDLWPSGDVPARHYAYLEDRIRAYADLLPQRYGTQGACAGKGNWQPKPIEAPEGLDARREKMGLPTYAEQKARLDAICL